MLNFFPVGWARLLAVHEHGLAYFRSLAFYNTTLLCQWMRIVGDVVFAAGALLMAFDFLIKLEPVLPAHLRGLLPGSSGGTQTKEKVASVDGGGLS